MGERKIMGKGHILFIISLVLITPIAKGITVNSISELKKILPSKKKDKNNHLVVIDEKVFAPKASAYYCTYRLCQDIIPLDSMHTFFMLLEGKFPTPPIDKKMVKFIRHIQQRAHVICFSKSPIGSFGKTKSFANHKSAYFAKNKISFRDEEFTQKHGSILYSQKNTEEEPKKIKCNLEQFWTLLKNEDRTPVDRIISSAALLTNGILFSNGYPAKEVIYNFIRRTLTSIVPCPKSVTIVGPCGKNCALRLQVANNNTKIYTKTITLSQENPVKIDKKFKEQIAKIAKELIEEFRACLEERGRKVAEYKQKKYKAIASKFPGVKTPLNEEPPKDTPEYATFPPKISPKPEKVHLVEVFC